VFTVTFLREHALLKKLLRTDLYGTAETTAEQERHLRTVAELHTRLTLSFIVTPHSTIKLTTLDDTREYVRTYLLPMVTGAERD
jgi:hypothetical protein